MGVLNSLCPVSPEVGDDMKLAGAREEQSQSNAQNKKPNMTSFMYSPTSSQEQ